MIKALFSKYYSCDYYKDGVLVGNGVFRFWIWQSPIVACEAMAKAGQERSLCQSNFRRVK